MMDGSTNITRRILELRKEMASCGLDAYIFYGTDPHQSEQPATHWRDREWISGFTGSSGTVVVTSQKTGLWSDGRYTVQAQEELQGSGIEFFQSGAPDTRGPVEFLKRELRTGDKVGLDGNIVPLATVRKLRDKLADAEINVDPEWDLPTKLWKGRPGLPKNEIEILPGKYAGKSRREKIESAREKIHSQGANCYLESSLDCIAWLLNIRGGDIAYAPLAIAYLLLGEKDTALFIDGSKVPDEVRFQLAGDGVSLKPYKAVARHLQQLPRNTKIAYNPKTTPYKLDEIIRDDCRRVEVSNLVAELKTIKSAAEIENLKQVMPRDGVAQCKFFCWLEQTVHAQRLTETAAAEKAAEFRSEQSDFKGESFKPIPGYMAHAALPHYSPTPDTDSHLKPEGLFLLDSGGQYLGGTTDTTRTVALGPISDGMKRDFTLVLKGLINISRHRFVAGRKGSDLDILSRTPLWEQGLDFKHGTGHGVGSYLNVHEEPCGISHVNKTKLQPGMVLTIEPGLYRVGAYGIRLENMVLVAEDTETEFGKFYRFETLTLAPFDRNAIDEELLSQAETEWLNTYHERVFETLAPELEETERKWLRGQTRNISVPTPS